MGHTDVVGVQREKWSVDPFAATRKDGFIYGARRQDDKDNVAAGLMLMLLLKRMNVKLDRDVIFLAEAGRGRDHRVGIDFMVDQHWSEIDAEYRAGGGRITVVARRQSAVRRDQHHRKSAARRCGWWRAARPVTARAPRRTMPW